MRAEKMQVTVRYYGFFSTVTRKLYEILEVKEGYRVKDLIDILSGRYGCKFSQLCFIKPLYSEKEYVNICINTLDLNNIHKFPLGLGTTFKEGDRVSFGVMGGAA
jgi:molybdopterin converting factor small subunit